MQGSYFSKRRVGGILERPETQAAAPSQSHRHRWGFCTHEEGLPGACVQEGGGNLIEIVRSDGSFKWKKGKESRS